MDDFETVPTGTQRELQALRAQVAELMQAQMQAQPAVAWRFRLRQDLAPNSPWRITDQAEVVHAMAARGHWEIRALVEVLEGAR
jgi:predicted aspartyl protease